MKTFCIITVGNLDFEEKKKKKWSGASYLCGMKD